MITRSKGEIYLLKSKLFGIKKKFLACIVVITVITSLISAYILINYESYLAKYDESLNIMISVDQVNNLVEELSVKAREVFVNSKDQKLLDNFNVKKEELKKLLGKVEASLKDDESRTQYNGLERLVNAFIQDCDNVSSSETRVKIEAKTGVENAIKYVSNNTQGLLKYCKAGA